MLSTKAQWEDVDLSMRVDNVFVKTVQLVPSQAATHGLKPSHSPLPLLSL